MSPETEVVLMTAHGTVESVKLINDRDTGRPRGFGFVEMREGDAQGAIQAMKGSEMNGRQLRVNEAQERPPRPRSSIRRPLVPITMSLRSAGPLPRHEAPRRQL